MESILGMDIFIALDIHIIDQYLSTRKRIDSEFWIINSNVQIRSIIEDVLEGRINPKQELRKVIGEIKSYILFSDIDIVPGREARI